MKDDPIYSGLLTEEEPSVTRGISDGDGTVAIHLIGHVGQDRMDADQALGPKPIYYLKEDWEDNKENVDLSIQDVPVSADQNTSERDIFGGSSPLSPAVSRAVSWHPTTPDPASLTPPDSPTWDLLYPVTDDEGDMETHESDS